MLPSLSSCIFLSGATNSRPSISFDFGRQDFVGGKRIRGVFEGFHNQESDFVFQNLRPEKELWRRRRSVKQLLRLAPSKIAGPAFQRIAKLSKGSRADGVPFCAR